MLLAVMGFQIAQKRWSVHLNPELLTLFRLQTSCMLCFLEGGAAFFSNTIPQLRHR